MVNAGQGYILYMEHNENEIIPPHNSIFLRAGSNSQLTSVITKDKKITPAMILVQKNSVVKTLCLDVVHLTLSHLVLLVTASGGFVNGSVANILDLEKITKV